ncbi:MAG: serine/threonine-protein kinase [Myxococcota bacterium]
MSTEYTFVESLQQGGMGTVELVLLLDGRFRRLFARKRVLRRLRYEPHVKAMFREEARIAGLLRHQNLVAVLDVGEDRDGPFMVMEYVDGLSLSAFIKQIRNEGSPPLQAVVRIMLGVARGLCAAHELRDVHGAPLNLIHRDITPQNILLGWDGAVRLSDFGIAKAAGRETETTVGLLKGKPGYMSPEQLTLGRVDHRSDLFSLGGVLYEAASGRRLYRGDDADRLRRILQEAAPDLGEARPDAPPELVQLAFDLLAKDPALRPQHTSEVVDRLEEVLDDLIDDQGSSSLAQVLGTYFGAARAARERQLGALVQAAEARARKAHRARRAVPFFVGAIAVAGTAGYVLSPSASNLANEEDAAPSARPEPQPPARVPIVPAESEGPEVPHAGTEATSATSFDGASEGATNAVEDSVVPPAMTQRRRSDRRPPRAGRRTRSQTGNASAETETRPPSRTQGGPLHQWHLEDE